MHEQAAAGLREVRGLLATFTTPSCIQRAGELGGAADKVASCAAELLDVESERLQHQLATAVRSIRSAERTAASYERNPLTRPISQARFAMQTGVAMGAVQVALEELDPAEEAARDELRNR
ncbi:hypothetical protein LZ318_13540 [Saccharopolyspora indica]|uniref:hypothetical protein n=1 Tax=Saccharopolyspora indica TaxID=1229659 RepID=UPI0022EB1466|nr:hypothetical protein [Saccharopolyspora indica]MDA3647080.1 hypothetical protein [Saccharopolyspora indica]